MKALCLLLIGSLLCSTQVHSQNRNIYTSKEYPQNYFRNPLNIPMDASGTFGELRSTHFHAGDDYRTQQRIGLPLHAAAQGYVSRVRVQIGGGGNSVYIDHPNGYTTTYLHMDTFNAELTKLIRSEQYKQKRFDVDITLIPNEIKLNKGQFIGNAGNSGGSGGPHLHFEIRDTKTQRPLNPQLFGLRFRDNFAPTINAAMLYDLNDELFNEHTPRKPLAVKTIRPGQCTLSATNPVEVNGKFGLGISTIDRHRAGGFQNGVYSIDLFIDAVPVSTVVFEELDFNTSRGIHAYIDYPHWKKTKVKIQKSFKDPGNKIEIFKTLNNGGIVELTENRIYDVKYVVKDIAGNCSELNFKIKNNVPYAAPLERRTGVQVLSYNRDNTFEKEDIKATFPKGSLYNDIDFQYNARIGQLDAYSLIHEIHNSLTPIFSAYTLSIKPTSLPEHLQAKALIASIENGAEGGKYENGFVTVNTRNLGSFYVAVDTIAPAITARNLTNGKIIQTQRRIDFTISDNFSGIQSFHGYINNQWVLMEYDSKNRHLWHTLDPNLPIGEHQFKLVVTDWKDNARTYEASFIKK